VSKASVLIIDDEVDILTMLKFKFEKGGYTVATAENGLEGLAQLKHFSPDIIILDVNMPKMGGIEFYNEICIGGRPKFPVYVLTARANLEDLFKDLEVEGFMSKPFEIDDLFNDVERIILKNKGTAGQLPLAAVASKSILIAENDAENLKRIAMRFLDAGFQVSTAHNGASAIEKIGANLPDVAVIKWELGDMNGDAIALKFMKMEKTRSIRFILFTNHPPDDIKVMNESRKRSAVERIVESSQPGDLLEEVMDCLKRKAGENDYA